MLPHPEPAAYRLVIDPAGAQHAIACFVRDRCFVDAGNAWREVERHFSDQHAFMDFSARKNEGRERILIEFGLKHAGTYRRMGFLDAYWDAAARGLGQIVTARIGDATVDLDAILDGMRTHLVLPLTSADIVDDE